MALGADFIPKWLVKIQGIPPSDRGAVEVPKPTVEAAWESRDLNVMLDF